MDPRKLLPFEIKTTQLTQVMAYLWIPLLASLPLFIAGEIRIIPYLIAILVMMIVFLSFFLATQSYLKKDSDEDV
jgi:hypothetical protein